MIAYGGLEPAVRLAEWCGLPALTEELVRLPVSKDGTGTFPAAKVVSLVGGMVAGADSIDDMGRLRHGRLPRLFAGVRAPSTLGCFCVPSRTGMSSNCALWTAGCCPAWPRALRCCPVRTRSPM
ncbi:hypothetical protein [Streptomyces sp. NBC_00154]|uniref:hypothetical protein n=1 Tax=Streptomyces sp. NBC_00154 TaxID=2975670 RepID=UPI00224D3D7E|nr:hypothetical protein [Streptomyces sp. NBC_00154]MCX5309789.1 hypothetical protein [Streptomyces sp. NBC_00154]